MQDITELTVLSRVTVKLPDNLELATETFQEGWSFVKSGDVHWVDKNIRRCGWHFIWIAESSRRSGVAQTEQAAIAAGLKLALRRISPAFNAASINNIEIIRYPWFIIAKLEVYPYQIQQSSILELSNTARPLPAAVPGDAMPARGTLVSTAV